MVVLSNTWQRGTCTAAWVHKKPKETKSWYRRPSQTQEGAFFLTCWCKDFAFLVGRNTSGFACTHSTAGRKSALWTVHSLQVWWTGVYGFAIIYISDSGTHHDRNVMQTFHTWDSWMTSLTFVDVQHPHSKHKDCLYRKWEHDGEKNVLLLWTWFLCWKEGGGTSSQCSVQCWQSQLEKITQLHWGGVLHLIPCCPIPIWCYFRWQRIRLKQHLMVTFPLLCFTHEGLP